MRSLRLFDRFSRFGQVRWRALTVTLACVVLVGCKEVIVHDLGESESHRIIAALAGQGIEARKSRQADGRWSIEVERVREVNAIRFLDEARLLRQETTQRSEKSGLMSSRDEERHDFESRMAQQLEETLQNIPAVIGARVHINLPPIDPLWGQPLKGASGSASVLLVVREGEQVSREQISTLVSGASGISKEAVVVVLSFKRVEVLQNAPIQERISASQMESLSGTLPSRPLQLVALIGVVCGALMLGILTMRALKKRKTVEVAG